MAKIIRKLQDYFTKIPNKGIFVKKQEGKEHKKRASALPYYISDKITVQTVHGAYPGATA